MNVLYKIGISKKINEIEFNQDAESFAMKKQSQNKRSYILSIKEKLRKLGNNNAVVYHKALIPSMLYKTLELVNI